jgi:hypothetical protein
LQLTKHFLAYPVKVFEEEVTAEGRRELRQLRDWALAARKSGESGRGGQRR